jgi:uncharacterized membrane protein
MIASWIIAKKGVAHMPNILSGLSGAVLYMAVLSTYYFYSLLGIKESFIFLFILSLTLSAVSFAGKSQVIYLLASAGAFFALIIMSQGENSYRFLFVYLTVLNLLHLFMISRFNWKAASYIIIVFNYIIYSVWLYERLSKSSFIFPFYISNSDI